MRPSLFEAPPDLLGAGQSEADAAPMIAVERLGDHRPPDLRRRRNGFLGGADQRSAWRGHARGGQERFRQMLVARGFDRDQRGVAGDRCAEYLLPAAPAKAEQALIVEATDRDVAPLRLRHQRGGGGPEPAPANQVLERRQLGLEIERTFSAFQALDALEFDGQQAVHQPKRGRAGRRAHGLVAITEQDIVDARAALHGAGLATGDRGAGHGLELQGDMFDDVTEPGPFLQALQQPARGFVAAAVGGQARQQGDKPVGKTWQAIRRPRLQPAKIYLQADHRQRAKQMRSAIDRSLQQPQGRACDLS